jgi:Ca2+-binding RTX toxin-like protein
MRFNRKTVSKLAAASNFELQGLESRVLMTAVPLKVAFSAGLLSVTGSTGDDQITVGHVGNAWTIANGSEWTITKTYKTVTKLAINAKAGNDTIALDSSVTVPSTLLGDLGNDTITTAGGNTSINGGAGDDSLSAGAGIDILVGSAGNDTLTGAGGADKLIGNDGDDSIDGNGGNDTIQGGLGNDTMSGGNGVDTIDYTDHTALQAITADLTAGTVTRTGESDTFAADFEKFSASLGADSITGTAGDDIINAQAGNDTIDAGDGNDALYDGAGNDSVTAGNGNDSLYGDAGNDSLDAGEGNNLVRDGAGNDTITAGAGNDEIHDGTGNDSVTAGDGNDSLYSAAGNDSLDGGEGDDTLIAIGGGTADKLTGGNGNDTFWCDSNVTESVLDADMTETANGAVHKVGTFLKSISKEIAGQKIADPTVATGFKYRNFSDRPLFASNGPSIDDVAQGQAGDCYFLATMASIAKLDPTRIQQSVVALGDGTFAVRFFKNNVAQYVRVDGDLATYSWSTTTPGYAKFGAEGSSWVAIIEKAFAVFRKGLSTYKSIDSGLMNEVYTDFGVSSNAITPSGSADPDSYLASIKALLDSGKSVTSGCWAIGGANMVTSHAYTIDHMVDNGDGTYSVVVRNPWGSDGYSCNDGANDGYVTLTAAQAYVALGWVCAATV